MKEKMNSESDGEKKEKKQRCQLCKALAVMYRNPNLGKAVIASGLQMAGASVANMLAIQPLQALYWQNRMAQYTTIFATAQTVIAIIGSGPFGRFSDKVDRRIAACLFGAGTFLPSWALLICGLSETGLFFSSLAQVLSGFVVSTNAMLVLTNDVTPEEIRGIGFGLFYSINNAMLFCLQALPPAVKMTPQTVLFYQLVISAGFFLLIFSLKLEKKGEEEEENAKEEEEEELVPAKTKMTLRDRHRWNPIMAILRPMLLAWKNPALRGLCLAAGLLSVSSCIVFMNSSQYYRSELNLFPYGTAAQQQMVSFISALPGEILVIPGYMFMGILDSKLGSLTLFRWYIPIRSVMILLGTALHFAPDQMTKWCLVPLTDVMTAYGSLVYLPLNRLIADFAEGRVGEAMGALGQVQQIAGQFSNIPIALGLTQWLQNSGFQKPEWLYYVISSGLGIIALAPALYMKPPGSYKEASSHAEDVVDIVFSEIDKQHTGRISIQEMAAMMGEYLHNAEKIFKYENDFAGFCQRRGLDPQAGVDRETALEFINEQGWTFDDDKLSRIAQSSKLVGSKLDRRGSGASLGALTSPTGVGKAQQQLASLSRAYSMELNSRTATSLDARPLYLPRTMTGHDALEIHMQHSKDDDDDDDDDEEEDESDDSDDEGKCSQCPCWRRRSRRGVRVASP